MMKKNLKGDNDMSTVLEEKKAELTTGNRILDMNLPLMTDNELERLADYTKYLIWSRIEEDDDDDGSWADAPLTQEEEAQFAIGRENAKNGKYLTLAEFKESQKCGQ